MLAIFLLSLAIGLDGAPKDQDRTLIVTTIVNVPYVMYHEGSNDTRVNVGLYTGFAVEMIEELSKILGFSYKLKPVSDGKYGMKNATGHWNGMIGEVISGEADMALADLTITSKREEAIDFTMPFMTTGISILGKKPLHVEALMWWSPIMIWIYSIVIFFGLTRFLIKRRQRCPAMITCTKDLAYDELKPRCSTRFFALTWKLFALVMIIMAFGSFAVMMTCVRSFVGVRGRYFESAADLVDQTDIRYGTVAGGSTRAFFLDAQVPLYRNLSMTMESDPSNFVGSYIEGVNRVKMGNYAMFMESDKIQYLVQREPDLYQIGGNLDNKGFGIAVQSGSPYRALLSDAILQMQETGRLEALRSKWWDISNQTKSASYHHKTPVMKAYGWVSCIAGLSAFLLIIAFLIELVIFAKEKCSSSN